MLAKSEQLVAHRVQVCFVFLYQKIWQEIFYIKTLSIQIPEQRIFKTQNSQLIHMLSILGSINGRSYNEIFRFIFASS